MDEAVEEERRKEKEIFQKLIDDNVRIEHELTKTKQDLRYCSLFHPSKKGLFRQQIVLLCIHYSTII